MSKVYRHSDKAIKRLRSEMSREFQNMSITIRPRAMTLRETRRRVAEMYDSLYEVCLMEYEEVAERARRDAQREAQGEEKPKDEIDFVKGILSAFSLLTKYSYRNEWRRKRDRLVESLMTCETRIEVRVSLQRALNVLDNQVRQYADIVTDEARLDAFEEAGVRRVRWNTQHDGRVCGTCDARDGQVYDIHSLPTKHYRCRCYYTPVF